MHLFKAIGIVTDSFVSVVVKTLKVFENVAEMGESMSSTMVEESKAEATIARKELEDKYPFLVEENKKSN